MTHRAVRLMVLAAAIAGVGGGGYLATDIERQAVAERGAERVFEAQAYEAALLVERLRGAQQSYVAEGQGSGFWMGRVTETAGALDRTLVTLSATATSEAARRALQNARGVLVDYRKMDRRAREYVQSDQRLLASDLIFTESMGATTMLAASIDHARVEQQRLAEASLSELRTHQMYVLAGAAAVCLLAALLLVAPTHPAPPRDTREALRALMNDGAPAGTTLLRPEPPQRVLAPPGPPPSQPTRPEAQPPPAVAAHSAATVAAAAEVDLASAARICSELARVLDPADLPVLLERAAGLLQASGLIVWVADRAGASLFPMLAHGYAPSVLARMGSIDRDADNAAAAAFREVEVRTVAAEGARPGALVTPIVTAEGCVGVLAAEIHHGAEDDTATRAIAQILAAQLATFVTTLPPARAEA